MKVGNEILISNIYKNQANISSDAASKTSSKTESQNEQVTISAAGHSAGERWQFVASQYDVTDISTNERASMAGKLRKNNLISAEQQLRLTAPLSINDDLSTKVDYLTMIKESREVAEKIPAALKSLKILEHLHELSENSRKQ